MRGFAELGSIAASFGVGEAEGCGGFDGFDGGGVVGEGWGGGEGVGREEGEGEEKSGQAAGSVEGGWWQWVAP